MSKHRKKISFAWLKRSLAVLLLILICGFINEGFQQVLDQTTNEKLKQKLLNFQQGGLERRVICQGYDAGKIISYAKSLIGTPHTMGGIGENGFDCSGLVYHVHGKFGIQLPHSSHEQARYGTIIADKSELIKGDLVFFYNSYASKNLITHVGIYLSDGNFIHTSHNGVTISKLDDGNYWQNRYLFATRLIY